MDFFFSQSAEQTLCLPTVSDVGQDDLAAVVAELHAYPERYHCQRRFPDDGLIVALSKATGVKVRNIRTICAEIWRMRKESENPRSRGSAGIPERLITANLNRSGKMVRDYYIVRGLIESWDDEGSSGELLICRDVLATAMMAYLLANGNRYFDTLQEFHDAVRREQWPGWEEFIRWTRDPRAHEA